MVGTRKAGGGWFPARWLTLAGDGKSLLRSLVDRGSEALLLLAAFGLVLGSLFDAKTFLIFALRMRGGLPLGSWLPVREDSCWFVLGCFVCFPFDEDYITSPSH